MSISDQSDNTTTMTERPCRRYLDWKCPDLPCALPCVTDPNAKLIFPNLEISSDRRMVTTRDNDSVFARNIWNNAIEAAASRLEVDYPGHTWVNAYCASIRMLKR